MFVKIKQMHMYKRGQSVACLCEFSVEAGGMLLTVAVKFCEDKVRAEMSERP